MEKFVIVLTDGHIVKKVIGPFDSDAAADYYAAAQIEEDMEFRLNNVNIEQLEEPK